MAQPPPGTQCVVRATRLLKLFGDERPAWGLSDLARAAGLNKTTAYRLLGALESTGMVARDDGERYRLGPEAVALGARALRSSDLHAAAHPELEALAREGGETATLEVLAGGQVVILDEALGRHLVGAAPSVGTRWPAHATSTGKALLAHLPASGLKAALGVRRKRYTPATLVSAAALRRELARVRAQGYAVAWEELEPGFAAVGAPVRNAKGQVVGAISLGGPCTRLGRRPIEDLGRLVRDAAARISRRLGYAEG